MLSVTHLAIRTWNVLADAYVSHRRYPDVPSELLRAGARDGLIISRVAAPGPDGPPDVVVLQEVEPALAEVLARVLGEDRLLFHDGNPASGHVAHLVGISQSGWSVVIANTHLRYSEAKDQGEAHIGMRQLQELVTSLNRRNEQTAVIAGDVNDRPGGPVRTLLRRSGYVEYQDPGPTAIVAPDGMVALDVVAVRGGEGRGSVIQPWWNRACPRGTRRPTTLPSRSWSPRVVRLQGD